MFGPKKLAATLDGLEIGATGPGTIHFVLSANGHLVTTKLTAAEARWLASALEHWAASSETIAAH